MIIGGVFGEKLTTRKNEWIYENGGIRQWMPLAQRLG
jgi:hypothetical protein